jgi:hypothetical protein
MPDDEAPVDVALKACAEGHEVLVLMRDGERFDAHIAALRQGGFVAVVRLPGGRVERFVSYEQIDSMAAYLDPTEFPNDSDEDELQALSQRLREAAHMERQTSLAEKMLRDSERTL